MSRPFILFLQAVQAEPNGSRFKALQWPFKVALWDFYFENSFRFSAFFVASHDIFCSFR